MPTIGIDLALAGDGGRQFAGIVVKLDHDKAERGVETEGGIDVGLGGRPGRGRLKRREIFMARFSMRFRGGRHGRDWVDCQVIGHGGNTAFNAPSWRVQRLIRTTVRLSQG